MSKNETNLSIVTGKTVPTLNFEVTIGTPSKINYVIGFETEEEARDWMSKIVYLKMKDRTCILALSNVEKNQAITMQRFDKA